LQGAIIGINVFFLVRIFTGRDKDSVGGGAPSGGGGGGGGYASFPEGQESAEGDKTGPAYTPPEY
jgi:hypothetical protein